MAAAVAQGILRAMSRKPSFNVRRDGLGSADSSLQASNPKSRSTQESAPDEERSSKRLARTMKATRSRSLPQQSKQQCAFWPPPRPITGRKFPSANDVAVTNASDSNERALALRRASAQYRQRFHLCHTPDRV